MWLVVVLALTPCTCVGGYHYFGGTYHLHFLPVLNEIQILCHLLVFLCVFEKMNEVML